MILAIHVNQCLVLLVSQHVPLRVSQYVPPRVIPLAIHASALVCLAVAECCPVRCNPRKIDFVNVLPL